MYVIFPADEIILFSYGAIVPRFQPRPTLDNLREPLVRPGPQPTTTSNLDVTQINTLNNKKSSITSFSNSRQPSPQTPKPRRDRSPNITFADEQFYSSNLHPDPDNVSETDYLARSNLLDPITPLSESGANDNNNFSFNLNNNNNTSSNQVSDSTSGKKKSKLKSKIHISLGKLGRPHSNDQTESQQPSRVREDLDIRVSNPTFTSDNLRQKNFDAFFASGEPVYSLERKPDPEPASPQPIEASTTSLLANKIHSNSLAKLNFKPKLQTAQSVPAPSPSTPQYSPGSTERPKSAEFLRIVEQSQKGDRCPFKTVFDDYLLCFPIFLLI